MTGTLKFWRLAAALACAGGCVVAAVRPAEPMVHIALVGDSTVTAASGWGGAFARLLRPGILCTNAARSGTSTKSFLDAGLWARALALKPSWVLIQFGHNDMPGKGPARETDPATTFRENLSRYVTEARAAGAKPILISSLTRRNFKDGQLVDLLAGYAAATKAAAAEQQVPLVDLHRLSVAAVERLGPTGSEEFGPMQDGKRDNTHLSPKGAEWAADLVADELRRIAPELALLLK